MMGGILRDPSPRKEGRPFHYYTSARRRRRSVISIIGIGTFLVLAVIFLVKQSGVPSARIPHRKFHSAHQEGPGWGSIVVDTSKPASVAQSVPFKTPVIPPARVEQPIGEEIKKSPSSAEKKKPSTSHQFETGALTKIDERPGFSATLEKVISLLPDEIHVRELLRPFEGTGKEKLREIGLRVRAFKRLFEAWEALHVGSTDSATYVRDDVIQYVRSHPELMEDSPRSLAQTIHSYEAYRSFLQRLSMLLFPWTAPYFSDHMTLHSHFAHGGRGIVITAGDEQAPYLRASIPSFRRLGCNLPIEIMYLGDSDLSEDCRAELEALPGVITRDISQMVNDEGWRLAGWAGKPFTILFSSFRETILIDADALFFVNPEKLFDDPAYVKTGALFFRDRLFMPESKKRWLQQILPQPISKQVRQSRLWTGESGHMQESGVLVIDKVRHFVALLLITRMNGPDRDGDESRGLIGIYDMVYGDKETFWIGWELVGDTDYAFHEGVAGIMGAIKNPAPGESPLPGPEYREGEVEGHEAPKPETGVPGSPDNYTICAPQLLHLDRDGKPLWFNGWLWDNKFAGRYNKRGGDFKYYMREPRIQKEPGAWMLGESNLCCLTMPDIYPFDEQELETLEMIKNFGREVGSYRDP